MDSDQDGAQREPSRSRRDLLRRVAAVGTAAASAVGIDAALAPDPGLAAEQLPAAVRQVAALFTKRAIPLGGTRAKPTSSLSPGYLPLPSGRASADTANLSAALATGGAVQANPLALAASYHVNGTVTVGAGTTWLASNVTLVLSSYLTGATPLVLHAGATVDGLVIDGAAVRSGYGTNNGAVALRGAAATVRNVTITHFAGAGIVAYSTGYTIAHNTITNLTGQGILLSAGANGGSVINNRIDTALHGVQWYGGDAATGAAIGISDVTISHNTVSNVEGGGIWGALGAKITVTANTVDTCGDVGVDFEGCQNCTATANTITDCVNGCMTLFYGGTNLTFTANTCISTGSYGPCFYAHGNGSPQSATAVTLSANTMNLSGPAIAIVTDEGAVSGLTISGGNTIASTGGGAGMELQWVDDLVVTGNSVRVASSVGIGNYGGLHAMISANRVISTGDGSALAADAGGILNYWTPTAPHTAKYAHICDNYVSGFVKSIYDDNWGDNNSSPLIANNTCDNLYLKGNHGWGGTAVNNVTPAGSAVTASVS